MALPEGGDGLSVRGAPSPERGSHLTFLLPALLLTVAVYYAALGTFFAQDDITFLSRAAGLEPSNGLFRPLSAGLAFRLQHAVFGLGPLGYHVVNLVLHLLNVAGVYALGLRLMGERAASATAAVLFGCSSVAFTPLHWATGVIELLMGTLIIGATLLHVESHHRSQGWRWAAAFIALLAMLSKETAAAWILVILLFEWRSGRVTLSVRSMLPAAIASLVFASFFMASGQAQRFDPSEAYARSTAPVFLVHNFLTYVRWCVALWEPIRDVIAAVDPGAWRIAVPVSIALGVALWRQRREVAHPVEVGMAWWVAFLLPVLPLTHHTYLYYLYVPWAGAAIALAALGQSLLARWPRRPALAIGWATLGAYVLIEAHNVGTRQAATRDSLPVDRTIRDATLLSHALPTLQEAALPPGTRVLFVSPVTRARFDLMTGAPTREEDLSRRRSYWPLEAAMREGETLRLFVPQIVYLGFTTTIPPGRESAECFRFDQRGWLESWGHGRNALMRQARMQREAQHWAEAESTLRRLRPAGATLPGATTAPAPASRLRP